MKIKLLMILAGFLLLLNLAFNVRAQSPSGPTGITGITGPNFLFELVNIFFTGVNPANLKISPAASGKPNVSPLPAGSQISNYAHYYQCDPTFNPATNPNCGRQSVICAAGCGQTTVAMILTSFGKIKTPLDVYKDYISNGYLSGCDGSFMPNAMTTLNNNGITTGNDFIPYSQASVAEVASDLKNYFTSGWTGFALADFCDRVDTKCSHFFWITGIDGSGDITTNDSVRGKGYVQGPSDPFPKYKYVFLVKTSL